jgi:3-phenylpropionate/cinnamic acid dioxygenase small subunit
MSNRIVNMVPEHATCIERSRIATEPMGPVAMSVETNEITRVLIRYATAVDTRDWDLFRSCFTDDAITDYGELGAWTDVDSITEFMIVAHAGMGPSKHFISNFDVEVDGDHAYAVSYLHAVLVLAADPRSWIDTVGHYEDRFVRTSEGWRIKERQFRTTRMIFGNDNLALDHPEGADPPSA